MTNKFLHIRRLVREVKWSYDEIAEKLNMSRCKVQRYIWLAKMPKYFQDQYLINPKDWQWSMFFFVFQEYEKQQKHEINDFQAKSIHFLHPELTIKTIESNFLQYRTVVAMSVSGDLAIKYSSNHNATVHIPKIQAVTEAVCIPVRNMFLFKGPDNLYHMTVNSMFTSRFNTFEKVRQSGWLDFELPACQAYN